MYITCYEEFELNKTIYKKKKEKLLSQGYQKTKPVATFMKFCGRHHDRVNPYNVAVSRIFSNVFANDEP